MNEQEALIRALRDPARYGHPADEIELIETHISWVLLSGAYAYKIKKAVNLGFLDFSTLEKRLFCCEEELRLNQRLAPSLYLAVVSIGGTPDQPVVGRSPAIEYAVKMARFPQSALFDHLLAAGELSATHIDAIACEVARFHGSLATFPVPPGLGTPEAVHRPVLENFSQLAACGHLDPALSGQLRLWSEEEFARHHHDFTLRRESGQVRECHGDLHLGNMAWLDGHPVLFDCIEFNPELRWIDVMSDAAFVVMDLHDRGRPALARRFLNTYLEQTGDFAGLRVLPYYLVYRAVVRAKVAAIHASQSGKGWDMARDYLCLAARLARPVRPWLLITHGYSGSGKSTATRYLLEQTGAIRLRSDVERKRLFGLAADARSQSGLNAGLYAPDTHTRTYRHLDELARKVLQAGFPVIVDAAFLKRGEREAFHRLASELGVPFLILELRAGEQVLRQRIVQREQDGRDASEATLPVLEQQLRGGEAVAPEERAWTITIESETPVEALLHPLAIRLIDNPDKFCQDLKF